MKRSLWSLMGLGLAGYGTLVLLRVITHESMFAGAASLIAGLALLVVGLPPLHLRHGKIVAAIGGICVAGVLLYNLARRSDLGIPEWGILAYGLLLLLAASRLDHRIRRLDVGTLVAWSFPLILAPLTMFSLNAGISAGQGETAASPIVHALVVLPSAALLGIMGTSLDVVGNSFVMDTPRGSLTLGVGLVCAGLYPMVLFGGLVALHGWQNKLRPGRLAAYLGTGILGLWFVNLIRLVILTRVGARWGVHALETVHAHIGWILFAGFMVLFWGIVLRKIEGRLPPAQAAQPDET